MSRHPACLVASCGYLAGASLVLTLVAVAAGIDSRTEPVVVNYRMLEKLPSHTQIGQLVKDANLTSNSDTELAGLRFTIFYAENDVAYVRVQQQTGLLEVS